MLSINYQSKLRTEADEIRCPYNQLGLIYKLMQLSPEKRYVIVIDGILEDKILQKAIEQIDLVKSITENYTIECNNILTFYGFQNLKYNTFLSFPVTDWETFSELKALQVTDIYIDGPLGFQTNKLREGKGDIKLRATPTVSPNKLISTSAAANFFFIRPEDLSLYEDTIDIFFFKTSNQEQEDALFKVYKRRSFAHELDKLIPQINQSVPNIFIKQDFAQQRLNCGQRCKTPGYACHFCDTEFQLTNMVVKYFKTKETT